MLEFVDLNLHLTHLVILWQLLYGTVFNKAWCVSFLVCSSKGAEHEGSLKTQRNTAWIEEVPLKKILRGHSEIDSTKCSVEFRLSFPQQTATLNWFGRMSFVRVRWKSRGHTEHLTGDDNMDQQSQPVKRKTVQLMLWFSSDDDSFTFCLLKQPFCTTIRRFWTVCFGVDWTETWQSSHRYQPVLCLQSGRSFHVVFWLFHSSVVLSCHRILLILEKYNITKRIKFIFLAINTFF